MGKSCRPEKINMRVTTSQYEIYLISGQNSHLPSQNVFFQSVIYSTKKTITLAWGKSRVFLQIPLFYTANPATDEVRMENRNHGLAWLQSGNNKTVQRLLSLFKRLTLPFRKTLSWSLLSHNAVLQSWCSFSLSCTSFLQFWICKLLSVII